MWLQINGQQDTIKSLQAKLKAANSRAASAASAAETNRRNNTGNTRKTKGRSAASTKKESAAFTTPRTKKNKQQDSPQTFTSPSTGTPTSTPTCVKQLLSPIFFNDFVWQFANNDMALYSLLLRMCVCVRSPYAALERLQQVRGHQQSGVRNVTAIVEKLRQRAKTAEAKVRQLC